MLPSADHGQMYHPKDAIRSAATAGFQVGTIGAMFAGIKATLTKQNIGAMGAVTKYGSIIAMFAVTGTTFAFVKDVTSNLRENGDWKSSMVGGMASGSLIGVYRRSLPGVLGYGVLTGVFTSILTYSGGELRYRYDPEADVFAEKQAGRKNWRSPAEQTLAEVGEGRGIYGPGYAERRKQRLKETYGVDIP